MAIELSGRPFSGCTKVLILGFGLFMAAVIVGAIRRAHHREPFQPAPPPQPRVVATLGNGHVSQTLWVGPRWQIRWWSQSGDLRIGLTDGWTGKQYTARDFDDPDLSGTGLPFYPDIESSTANTITVHHAGQFEVMGVPAMVQKDGQAVDDRWTIEISELP